MQTRATNTWSWGRIAILVVAVLELLQWLTYLPSLFLRPLSEIPTSGFPGLLMLGVLVVFPLLALTGAILAIKGWHLRRAAWLVAVQPAVYVLSVIAFAVGVMRHGF